jgi:GMP synthase-like glutamine amidotransferase
MTPRPLRIAILECDTPPPGVQKTHGTYGGLFTSLLRDAASSLSPPLPESDLIISAYDVVKEIYPPSLDDIDGILMTGSKHNSFENDPWILKLVEYTKKVLAQDRVRIVGVCFGHQIVGRALGALVGRSEKGWELSVTDLTLTPAGKEIFGQEKLVCAFFKSLFGLRSSPD